MVKKFLKNRSFINILGSSGIKIVSSAISFITIPMLLSTLGTKTYGVWVTLTAMLGWMTLFDFGIGYSLKNKVTELAAVEKNHELQELFLGSLQFYIFLTLIIFLLFVGALYFVNVFEEHRLLTVLVYLPVIMGFPFTIANFLLQGSRQFNLLNMIVFCQSLIWLVMVALVQNGILANNVYLIGLIYGLNCFFIYAILFFLALRILKLKLTNLFNFHTFKIAKNLIVTGLKFFFLQISSIFIFSLGNYLTYTNLNAESVAKYDTVNKIFLLMMSLYNIIIAVFWTDISHNIALKNKLKLKSIFKNLILISFVFDIAILLVYSCSPLLINFWTKGMIQITLKEIYGFPALMIFQSLALCGAVFLNAFEDFSIQIPFSLATSALIVPGVTLAFKYLHFGIGTVPIVTLILFLPGVYFCLNASIRRINSV